MRKPQTPITVDPSICHGKPCFTGTRIMVSTILELLESGRPYEEIRKGYPALTHEHIRTALHFAHQLIDREPLESFHLLVHATPR